MAVEILVDQHREITYIHHCYRHFWSWTNSKILINIKTSILHRTVGTVTMIFFHWL